jgi:hypothetical protein
MQHEGVTVSLVMEPSTEGKKAVSIFAIITPNAIPTKLAPHEPLSRCRGPQERRVSICF